MGEAVLPIGIIGFIIAVIVVIGGSVMLASQSNTQAASTNRQNNKPISNGYALPATIALAIMVLLAILFGIVPPLLRRG